MSEAVERAIRDILLSEDSTEKVVESFVKRLNTEAPSRKERYGFLCFLIHSGRHLDVLKLYSAWLKEKAPVSMRMFCYLLYKTGFKPGVDFLNPLFAAGEEQKEYKLTHFTPWEPFDERFLLARGETESKLQQAAIERKQKFIEKLEYLRSNRMIDEEERLLSELVFLYPEDPSFQHQKITSREQWARAVLSRRAFEAFDEDASDTEPIISEAELRAAAPVRAAITEIIAQRPELAYDFAIGMYFLELYEAANEILQAAPASRHVDWLRVELLYRARRYVECLDAITYTETQYADDPETAFGATYYRALALEGLGQIGTASDLLKSIVAIRPSYRSAHALLMKWRGS